MGSEKSLVKTEKVVKPESVEYFNYVVAPKTDGQVTAYNNGGEVFWGTAENAEALKKSAEAKNSGEYEVYRLVK